MKDYKEIEGEMRLWRKGFGSLPKSYVDYHKALAEKALKRIEHYYKVHSSWMGYSGDGCGMKLLYAVVESCDGRLTKILWSDSHRDGCFFARLYTDDRRECGGAIPFIETREQHAEVYCS